MLGSPLARLGLTVSGLAVAAASLVAIAPVASAAAVYSLTGDVTGDGFRDRVAFVDLGTRTSPHCVALVRVGSYGGTLAAPVTVDIRIPDNLDPSVPKGCPASGVLLTGARPALNRVALRAGALADFRPVYVINLTGRALQRGKLSPVSSFYGDGAGNRVGTVDLNGDNNADWWQTGTDQGEGGFLFVRDGDTFRSFYATGYARDPRLQFFDLNHNGGTDVLVTTATDSFNDPFAALVDGRTGVVRTVATGSYYGDPPVYEYYLAVVDLDHNRLPDLELRTVSDVGVTVAPRRFENRSKSGGWSFRDVTPPAAP